MSKTHASRSAPRRVAPRHLRLRPLVLALALAGGAALVLHDDLRAQVLPHGATVVQGQASIATQGNRMTVTNSAGAVLNWQSFSIGAANAVRFDQPSASSRVLNRVVGSDPSAILGSLSSNGQVWLLNPYGVLFGRDARVDVAGLVASTLSISDADWRAQRLSLTTSPQAQAANAAIVNQGELRTTAGGRVLLLAGAGGVSNSGLIEAPDGQIVLAAGRSVDLVDDSTPTLAMRVTAPAGEALNLGSLAAGGGRIDLQAAIVNQQGIVRAESIGGHGGTIELRAADTLRTGAGSLTSADGTTGGSVVADAGDGTALLAGALQARGSAGAGGSATLLGRQVGLLAGGAVDVSGSGGGGDVRVGGGLQGKDASVHNAQAVYFDPAASIAADAGALGNGGRIVLWSDRATRAYGTLSARGGAAGGDGGFIETSGGWIDARPRAVHADAPKGRPGTWLLDPNNLFISDGGPDTNIIDAGYFDLRTNDDAAYLSTATILQGLNSGLDVSISTQSAGTNSQAGDIVMSNATIDSQADIAVSLTLDANRNINVVSSTITSKFGAPLGLTLLSARDGLGTISIDNSSISTAGGNVLLSAPSHLLTGPNLSPARTGATGYDGNGVGVSITRSTIDAGGGAITIEGNSIAQAGVSGLAQGIAIGNNSVLRAHAITLTGWVDSEASLSRIGVLVDAGTTIAATQPDAFGTANSLTIDGYASSSIAAAQTTPLEGVRIAGALALGSGTATITGALNDQVVIPSGAWGVNLPGDVDFSGAQTATVTGLPSLQVGDGNRYNSFTASTGGATTLAASGTDASLVLNWGQFSGSPSALTLAASGANAHVDFNSTSISGDFPVDVAADGSASSLNLNYLSVGGNANLMLMGQTVQGGGSINAGSLVVVADSFTPGIGSAYGYALQVSTNGPITVGANSVTIGAGTTLTSNAPGDAIVITGNSGGSNPLPAGNATTFVNQAGAGALNTPNGRWQVFATDPTAGFDGGGLAYDAVVYGASLGNVPDYGPTSTTDRQFLFSVAPTLAPSGGGQPIVKTYDATRSVDLTASGQVGGLINGDRLAGLFDTKNVGVNKTIDVFPGGDAPLIATDVNGKPVYGYVPYQGVPFTLSGDITPAPLGVAGVSANHKVYDATPAATLNTAAASIAPLPGDVVTLDSAGAFASFADKNVGNAKPVTAGGFALAGADAGNYTLVMPGDLSADITPAPLAIAGISANSKVYDATTAATLNTSAASVAPLGGDAVTLVGSSAFASFADKNVGNAKPVTAGGFALAGADAGNYTLAQPTGLTADITPAALGVAGVSANSKVYDATTAATLNTAAASVAARAGDVVALGTAGAFASFADKNVGNAKPVTAGGFTLAGADAGNYTLVQPAGLSADITPAPLSIAGVSANNKPYDGTTSATLNTSAASVAPYAGDVVTLDSAAAFASFADKDIGNAKPVTAGGFTIGGADAGNYALAQPVGLSADITPAAIDLTALTAKIEDDTRPVPPLIPPRFSAPTAGRTVDATQAIDFRSGRGSFGSLDLANLSQDTIAALLDARDRFMTSVFAEALDKLAQDPTLADAPACATVQQAYAGTCLLTGEIKQAIIAQRVQLAAAAQAGAAPAPPAAAPAPAPAPAAAPAPSPAPAIAALPPPPPPLFAPRAVREATLPQIQRKLAVFIGNDDFTDPRIPRLDNAGGDAQAMAQVFGASLGYETLVLRDATRETILGTLNRLATEAGPRDSVVVYYAGHGQVVDRTGLGYWVPANADATRPETWISNTDISRLLAQISASQVALISDSCFSGGLVSQERIRVVPQGLVPAEVLDRRTAVVMSSGGNEPVADAGKQGHSTFAWSLMQSLQKVSTWRPGSNVFEQVRFAVARVLPQRPQYGAASEAGYVAGSDYLFEQRQLQGGGS